LSRLADDKDSVSAIGVRLVQAGLPYVWCRLDNRFAVVSGVCCASALRLLRKLQAFTAWQMACLRCRLAYSQVSASSKAR
ncbi:MAG: hypothetical protein LBF83_04935, partial [Spirochaetaceae bacterium]|nr:hypothetical protein [Spirochaetaceae bacterium]